MTEPNKEQSEQTLDISVDEVCVELEQDDKPDYVRLKFVDTDRKEVVGYTNVAILAD